LPMTTHTPPMTNAIAPLAFPSRSWVTNLTPSYTVPTHLPSPTLPSSALPALFVDMTSAAGPHTPHSNKLLFSLSHGPAPLNSSANTTKHGLTPPPLHAHNSSTHSNLTFSNTNPQPLQGPYRPSNPPLLATPLMIRSVRCVKVPLMRKKCFSVTYVTPVGIWTAFSTPSPPSLLGYGNVPCVPLLTPHPKVLCDTSASLLPSLTLTLTKHHLGHKNKNKTQKNILHLLPALRCFPNPPLIFDLSKPVFSLSFYKTPLISSFLAPPHPPTFRAYSVQPNPATFLTNPLLLLILPQTEAEPIFQEERTLVKGKQPNAEDATTTRL